MHIWKHIKATWGQRVASMWCSMATTLVIETKHPLSGIAEFGVILGLVILSGYLMDNFSSKPSPAELLET